MTKEEELFIAICSKLADAEQSQMFGKPCFKINSKAFVCFFQNCMVFKLTDKEHAAGLALADAELFDPSGKKRPMKEWVQVPFVHAKKWKKLAQSAYDYVLEQTS